MKRHGRIYLNSFDYMAGLLNHLCRLTPGRGNHFLVVLENREKFHAANIPHLTRLLAPCAALLSGRMRRHALNLAPYWEEKRRHGADSKIRITFESLGEHADFQDALNVFANAPLPPGDHLELKLFEKSSVSYAVFKFSHQLFDGLGAEYLLRALSRSDESAIGETPFQRTPMLHDWTRQFHAGRQVNRKLLSIKRSGPLSHPFTPHPTAAARFRLLSWTPEESAGIASLSERKAGPFMLTAFLLSAAARSMAAVLDSHHHRRKRKTKTADTGNGHDEEKSGNLLAYMSCDMRGTEEIPRHSIFFNQWSLLPLLIPRENLNDPLPRIREALYEANAERLPLAFRNAAYLARIAPYPLLETIFRNAFGKVFTGSFMFSHLPGTVLETPEFLGNGVVNLFHMPLMPPEPGVGFFFNQFHGRMNCVISCREGALEENDLNRIVLLLNSELTGREAH